MNHDDAERSIFWRFFYTSQNPDKNHSTNSPTAEGAMKALAHIAHRARITAVNFMVGNVVGEAGKVAWKGCCGGRVC